MESALGTDDLRKMNELDAVALQNSSEPRYFVFLK